MSLPKGPEATLESWNDNDRDHLNSFLVPLGNSGVTPPGQQMLEEGLDDKKDTKEIETPLTEK